MPGTLPTPRHMPWKLPCSDKSSKLVVCCRPFGSNSWKQSIDSIPTGQGYKVGQSKTCYKKNYKSPCHSCMTVWLMTVWYICVHAVWACRAMTSRFMGCLGTKASPWDLWDFERSFLSFLRVPIGSETVANVATQMLPHPSGANWCNLHDVLQSRWFQSIWRFFCTKLLRWRFVVWEHPSYFATGLFTVQRSLADIKLLKFSICIGKNTIRKGACIVSCTVWRQGTYTRLSKCCQLPIQEGSASFLMTDSDLPDSQSIFYIVLWRWFQPLWRIQVSMRESPPKKSLT